MFNNGSAAIPARISAWLRRYGLIIIVYVVTMAVSGAREMGDTEDFVRQIRQHAMGHSEYFWEFGHLFWRSFGYALFWLGGPLIRLVVGEDPVDGVRFSLTALSWLAGLTCVLFLHGMAVRVSARAWAAYLATITFIITQVFLNYTHTGGSYLSGMSLLMACFYFLSRPEAAGGGSTLGWLWGGLALAGSLSLWFPYLLAVPAALLSPFIWFGVDRQRLRLVLRTAVVFSLATGALFLIGAFNAGVRHITGLRQWAAESSHGIVGVNGAPRMVFGMARSLINMGNDGVLYKRFLLHDPFNPVSFSDLFRASLYKLGLFYLFLTLLLLNLLRTAEGRRIFYFWMLSAAPALGFAIYWQGGDMERYLTLYPATFVGLAYLFGAKRAWKAFQCVAVVFLAVMSYANLTTMTIPALERSQEAVVARIANMSAEAKPKSVLVTPYFQDELVNFVRTYPSHPIIRDATWHLNDLFSPGKLESIQWRRRFAVVALSTWQDGGEVWLAKRALAGRPKPEWIWAEGDDRNISWTDFPKFFSQIEMGWSVGNEDGFVQVQRSAANERFLQSLNAGADPVPVESNR